MLPILLEGTPLVNVSKQKYLGITIESNLTWALMFARKWHITVSILNGCRQKVLPNNIIKMLIDSLVFSLYVWSSSLGPSLSVSLLHLHNCGVHYDIWFT